MNEEWRDIKGYEGLYKISSYGRVKSLRNNHGKYREKILSPGKCRDYLYVILCKNGKNKPYKIHRLVAEAFIPNSNNYKEVNHKDENKQNNSISNLEWCDRKYNCNYGTAKERMIETQKRNGKNKGSKNPKARKVQCITTGIVFSTIKEAAEYYNICRQHINKSCQGKIKYCGKHSVTGEKLVWRYIDGKD